jgi:transcriptional regulator with XRE-family HTH domain
MSPLPIYVKDKAGFASRLKQARHEAGLTQRGLAFEGCSSAYICRMERGERIPAVWIAWGLAERLDVSAHWLVTGKESPLVLVARKVVEEYRAGVEVPKALIDRLDRLSRPASRPKAQLKNINSDGSLLG